MNQFRDDLPEVGQPRPGVTPLERRYVIAIDYGTTYTGVAIVSAVGSRAILNEIDVVEDWGVRMGNHKKIPSVISYSLKSKDLDNKEEQWGADLSPNAVAMIHTKLQLDVDDTSTELDLILQALNGMHNLNFQYIVDSRGPKYTRKGPEDIVEDYLAKVFDAVLAASTSFGGLTEEGRDTIDTDIVVTIPAEWGYRAKCSTFRALQRAGFNKETFPKLRDMLLVTEPEAAAIYTARYLKERDGADFLKKGECFVLCDAGGGTVDVVSYEVKQLWPTFEIAPVTVPTGGKFGSIFINLAFKKWLQTLLGSQLYQQLDPQMQQNYKICSYDAEGHQMRRLMKSFDIHKRKFAKGHRDIKLDLPEPFNNLNLDTRVVGGEITITCNDMESFFDARVDKIVDLIQGQVEQIEALHKTPRNVFLVGGFAESPYLKKTIEESLELRSLRLRIPDTSWTAVVRGAAIFGIEKEMMKNLSSMTACRRSYGLSLNSIFSAVTNNPNDLYIDPLTKMSMASGQLIWIIRKGDLILSNQAKQVTAVFPLSFTETSNRTGSIPVYAYDMEDLPDRLATSKAELELVHTIDYDLGNIPLHEFIPSTPPRLPFYTAELTLVMRMAPEMLHIQLKLGDREICNASVPEPEPVPEEWEV